MPGNGARGVDALLALGLAGGRLVIGAGIWVAPDRALAALGFDASHPAIRTVGRLTATRDLATGLLALSSRGDPAATRRVVLMNAAIDAGDTLAFGLALTGRDPALRRAGAVGAPAALAACAAGLALARRLDSAGREAHLG